MKFLKGILLAIAAFFITACGNTAPGTGDGSRFVLEAQLDGVYSLQTATCVSPEQITIRYLVISEQWVDVAVNYAPERWSKIDPWYDHTAGATRAALSGQVLTLDDGQCQATYLKK